MTIYDYRIAVYVRLDTVCMALESATGLVVPSDEAASELKLQLDDMLKQARALMGTLWEAAIQAEMDRRTGGPS